MMNTSEAVSAPPTAEGVRVSRNVVFAALFVCLSVATGAYAWFTLDIGTPAAMGPGFFPLTLSILLGVLSLLVGIVNPAADSEPSVMVPVRGLVPVILAPVIFGLTIGPLGLVLAMFLTVFEVTFASRFARLKNSLMLAVGFTAFCVGVFHYLLNLPIPLWGKVFGA